MLIAKSAVIVAKSNCNIVSQMLKTLRRETLDDHSIRNERLT